MEKEDLVTKDIGKYNYILRLATHPDYLRRGLATKLVEEHEELAKKNGFKIFLAESYSDISEHIFEK